MVKLKTLNDVRKEEICDERCNYQNCIRMALRQEAIKWIKFSPLLQNNYDTTEIELARIRTIEWIKMFFNITDKDLK